MRKGLWIGLVACLVAGSGCAVRAPATIIVPANTRTALPGAPPVAGLTAWLSSPVGTPQDFPPSGDSDTRQCKGRKDVGLTIVPCVPFKDYKIDGYKPCQYGTLANPLPPNPVYPPAAYCTNYRCYYNEEVNGDVLQGAIGRLTILSGAMESSSDCVPPYSPYPVCLDRPPALVWPR